MARQFGESFTIAQHAIKTIYEKFDEKIRDKRLEGIRVAFAALHTKDNVSKSVADALLNMDTKEDDNFITQSYCEEVEFEPEPGRSDYHIPK